MARAALLELDEGRTGPAGDLLDQIQAMPQDRDRGFTEAAQGILSLELGDTKVAETQLHAASEKLPVSSPLFRRVLSSLAEAASLSDDPDRAIELQGQLRSRGLGIPGYIQMFDNETSIAAAFAARGDRDVALKRITELTQSLDSLGNDASFLSQGSRRDLAMTESRARLLAGKLILRQKGHLRLAERELRYALSRSAEAPAGADRDQIRSSARILYGYALVGLGEATDGAEAIEDGVGELEQRRIQLRSADRRTAMIVADEELYRWAFKGLVKAQNEGVDGAAMTGAKLIESLRRSAIAETLRSGQLPLSEEAKDLVSEIANLERGLGEVEDDQRSGAVDNDDEILSDRREQLGRCVTEAFASAYLPEPVDEAQIIEAAAIYGNLLSFHLPQSGLPAWRSWVAPDGSVEIAELWDAGAKTREPIDAWLAEPDPDSGTDPLMVKKPLVAANGLWSDLAEEVLPAGLLARISGDEIAPHPERVVIIPDGPLSTFTWPALHINGEPIISRTTLSVSPSVDFLSGERTQVKTDGPSRLVAHVNGKLQGSGAEVEALTRSGEVEFVDSRDGFLAALDAGDLDGAYLAAHGKGMGLEQHVDFADDYSLSAAKALVHNWPPWAIFASCVVGRVEHRAGREPFGLAMSCMLGGAETFVSSLVEIPHLSAAEVCSGLAGKLATGREYAPDALRELQLRFLEAPGAQMTTIRHCLGLICISSVPPPPV